jgi:hypothetical protein
MEAPVSQSFQSYNKVSDPFSGRVIFSQGATVSARYAFLTSLASGIATLNLSTVVMPEIAYPSVNLTHFDFKRDAHNGLQLIQAEVWFEQVRVSAEAAFSSTPSATNTATPAGQTPQNGGTTQATNPTSAQTQTVEPDASQTASGQLAAHPPGDSGIPSTASSGSPSGGGGGSSSGDLYTTQPAAPLPAVPPSPASFPPGGGSSASQAGEAAPAQIGE